MTEKWAEDQARIESWTATVKKLLAQPPRNERERTWQAEVTANMDDARTLNAELNAIGIPFSIGELENVRASYIEAIPVLLKHLVIDHRPDIEASIIRALGVPYGGDAVFEELYRHLLERRDAMRPTTLFTLGNALAIAAGKSHSAELADIAGDARNGDARLQAVLKLGELKHPAVIRLATEMLSRNEYPWYALRALRRTKNWSAVDFAQAATKDPNPNIREEARKYVRAAEKAAANK